MSIGEIIREKRKEAGLTQKELASKIGVAQNTIAQYETGLRTPRLDQLTEIAKALNFSVVAFLTEDGYDPMGEYDPEDEKHVAPELESLAINKDRAIRVNRLYGEIQSSFLSLTQDITTEDLKEILVQELADLKLEDLWRVYFYAQRFKEKR